VQPKTDAAGNVVSADFDAKDPRGAGYLEHLPPERYYIGLLSDQRMGGKGLEPLTSSV
jgi:hypothetical protein